MPNCSCIVDGQVNGGACDSTATTMPTQRNGSRAAPQKAYNTNAFLHSWGQCCVGAAIANGLRVSSSPGLLLLPAASVLLATRPHPWPPITSLVLTMQNARALIGGSCGLSRGCSACSPNSPPGSTSGAVGQCRRSPEQVTLCQACWSSVCATFVQTGQQHQQLLRLTDETLCEAPAKLNTLESVCMAPSQCLC